MSHNDQAQLQFMPPQTRVGATNCKLGPARTADARPEAQLELRFS
jgi:hypothetical protein